jgi:hypothetical protein
LNAITFPNPDAINPRISTIFVDINNTVYVVMASWNKNQVQIWLENSVIPMRTITDNLQQPNSLFVTINGDIYIDNGNRNGRIDKWAVNATNSVIVMYLNRSCEGLFIDIKNTIYCSIRFSHQILKRSLDSSTNTTIVAAGTGSPGSESNELKEPYGIFVDINLNLYVADRDNSRIQLFSFGQLNGMTVAGKGSAVNFTLLAPQGIVVDTDGNMFITESGNSRIVVVGPMGSRCLVACKGGDGSRPHQLDSPRTMAFDSYGNMFVADSLNNRVQKFLLAKNYCGEFDYIEPKKSEKYSKVDRVRSSSKLTLLHFDNSTFMKSYSI